jgi:hypothetical protein
MIRAGHIALISLALILFTGCTTPAPREDYPAPNYSDYAQNQRRDFVEAFLQGRWCEAENLLALSTENFLQLDRFCEAAYNYLLFWRLQAYIGKDDPEALRRAEEMKELGKGCPEHPRLVMPGDGEPPGGAIPGKDAAYRSLLDARDYEGLFDLLAAEDNELYASVYARKAARDALDRGDRRWADTFLELALAVDSDQGWVVFLRRDWRLKAELAESNEEKESIANRIKYLDEFITPCE